MDRFVARLACLACLYVASSASLPPLAPSSPSPSFRVTNLRLRGGRVRYEGHIEDYDLQLMRAAAAAALRMDQTNPEGWLSLGDVRCMQGEWKEAKHIYAEGAHRCPNDLRLRQLAADVNMYYNPGEDQGWMQQPGFEEGEVTSFEVDVPPGSTAAGGTGKAKLIHASAGPMIPPDSCAWVVACAQASGEVKGSVTAPVEAFAPTVHVHVSTLSPVLPWFNEMFKTTCLPLLRHGFSLTPDECKDLRVLEAIVVRYDASPETGPGKAGLKRHVDAADFLVSIALNGQDEFEGGGLWIDALESDICGPAGTVIAIDPKLPHAGNGLASGTRHVLAVYVSRGVNRSGKKEGYTVEGLEKDFAEGVGKEAPEGGDGGAAGGK